MFCLTSNHADANENDTIPLFAHQIGENEDDL